MTSNLSVSQNFFKNPALVAKLVKQSALENQPIALDIGAGKGIITTELAKVCHKVIAYEPDFDLYKDLVSQFSLETNIEVLNQNFLTAKLSSGKYCVFSNIPFNLTSDIVSKLAFSANPPERCYLVMQNEAALRFLGKGEGTMISLLLQPFFDMGITYTFRSDDFDPVPGVDVVLLKMNKRPVPLVELGKAGQYNDFIVYVLSQQKPYIKLRLNKLFSSNQLIRLAKDYRFSLLSTVGELELDQWIGLFNYFCMGVEDQKKSVVTGSFIKHFLNVKNHEVSHRTKVARL